jgi:beta-N-acetylhexosaminidase
VARHALAFWRGLRAAGVLGCGKHFPGHGDTHADSHHELPVVDHDEDRLRAVELAPFAAAVAAGAEALMTAHVVYPAWDPALPATMSPRIVGGVLRAELGYGGLVVSDDLGMQAVAARWAVGETVERALLAGVDAFLIRGPEARQRDAFEGLVRAAERRSDVRARLSESAARVAAFKARAQVGSPAPRDERAGRLGPPAHRALAASFQRAEPRRM